MVTITLTCSTTSSSWILCSRLTTSLTICLTRTRPLTSTSEARINKASIKTYRRSTWTRMVNTTTHSCSHMLQELFTPTQKVTGMPQALLRAKRTKIDTCRSNSKTGQMVTRQAKHQTKTKSNSTWLPGTTWTTAQWCQPPWTQLISRTKWVWCTNLQL